MIINDLEVRLLDFHKYDSDWWISFLFIEKGDYQGALFHLEHTAGSWKFDFLWIIHWLIRR